MRLRLATSARETTLRANYPCIHEMDQSHHKYDASCVGSLLGRCGEGFLFRTNREWVVKLLLLDPSEKERPTKRPPKYVKMTAPEIIWQQRIRGSDHDGNWFREARDKLKREWELACTLRHQHLHPVKYLSYEAPALYLALPTDSLENFKHEYWVNTGLKKHPLAFTSNFTPRPHHRHYSPEHRAVGTHVWHTIAQQLVDVTRFLLDNGYAHLNLNPETVLYQFVDGQIRCWVTDYGSIENKNEYVTGRWQRMPNYTYTLPHNNASKESHALAQLLSTLLSLLFFDLFGSKGFFIGDTAAPLVKYNIWNTVEAAVRSETAPSDHTPNALRAIYNELRQPGMRRDEIYEYGTLALLFMPPERNLDESDTNTRLKNLLDILHSGLNPSVH